MSPAGVLRMDIVKRLIAEFDPRSVVEVGPGMGSAAWYLSRGREYLGYEPDDSACRVASERLTGHPMATVVNSPLPDQPNKKYEALVAFEVLEHIQDDQLALRKWREWLAPGGRVVLSVPAKQDRFGPIDTAVGHYRRYEKQDLMRLMTESGLMDVEILSYGMPLGYLLEAVRNRLLVRRLSHEAEMQARSHRSGRAFQPRTAGRLIRALTLPFVLLQRPFASSEWGIGWIATGAAP
jgi:SAM-dependent methyltransferase